MTTIKAASTPANTSSPLFNHVRYEHLVAGMSGGIVSTLTLHPLDLVKVRFAVNDGRTRTIPRYSGLSNAIKEILKTEGVRGLYRGVMPNVVGSGCSWGLYFFFYNSIKGWLQGDNSKVPLGVPMQMLAAADAGILTVLLTNPIWVVKTRMCLQYKEDVNLAESKRYKGTLDAIQKIYRIEGIRGLYKGLVPGMFGVSHGVIQFVVYEEMKTRHNNYFNLPIDSKLSTSTYMAYAAVSKIIAASVTYPYQVVRARLQDHHHNYKGSTDCIRTIWRSEGIKGYYKGIWPYLVHVMPNIIVVFLIYEHFS